MNIHAIEDEIERTDVLIKAAEKWSPQYKKNKKLFVEVLRAEARLERVLREYFRDFASRSSSYIDWYAYNRLLYAIKAADFEVQVLIEDGPIGNEDGFFIQATFDAFEQAVTIGATSGELFSGRDIGISRTSELVQKTALEIVAQLVGKTVDKNGIIVDNPKAKYRVTDTVRKDIRSAIAKSLNLGEDQKTATERIKKAISNPKRAEMIARTEAVNAYQEGLLAHGRETNAVGKLWQSLNNDDICADNARQGVIGINKLFVSGHTAPAAHPNCRCGMVIIYPEDPRSKEL